MMPKLLPFLLLLTLGACGTRGALTLPPGPAPAPLLGNPSKPAKAETKQKSTQNLPADSKAENNSTQPKATAE